MNNKIQDLKLTKGNMDDSASVPELTKHIN
ncbi:hypothetical protein OCHUTO_0328 [Orientia chuto str. Dubai]|uniref:Uncharacterized protein n=1 Tax=Orientia chuto str. Dubai TaxID=1359168 RepID=A0A0F3MQ91_9RICK|nr:hypothetical protein OCHUTO_0328 [Orientia chuto str. Dubai]